MNNSYIIKEKRKTKERRESEKKKRTLEDLEEGLDKRRPEEEGVGVKGKDAGQSVGERAEDADERGTATSERRRRSLLLLTAEEEDSSSRVCGT